jgi:hypothetical protein
MQRAFDRGWPIYFDGVWKYEDGKPLSDRPCARCGRPPVNGMDACLGHLDGVVAACCGHGVEPGYVLRETDSKRS